jgi:DNA adenine methylase
LFYCDPPYVHETKGDSKAYKHEMTNEQHEQVSKVLSSVKGMVALSNYDCELLDRPYPAPKWRKHKSPPRTIHSTKDKRCEVLWTNYDVREWKLERISLACL